MSVVLGEEKGGVPGILLRAEWAELAQVDSAVSG